MTYGVWQMSLFFILGHFLPIYLPNSPKIQNLKKKWKKHQEISFYTSVPKIMIICYAVPEIWHMTDVTVIFHFGLFFALLPSNSWKNQIFKKNEKNTWGSHHFAHVYQKLCLDDVQFLRYGTQQIDGQTDRKSDIKRWVPHLKIDKNS